MQVTVYELYVTNYTTPTTTKRKFKKKKVVRWYEGEHPKTCIFCVYISDFNQYNNITMPILITWYYCYGNSEFRLMAASH